MKAQKKGVSRIIKAFSHSLAGLKACWQSEAALRQEVILCLMLTVVLFFLPLSLSAKCILLSSLLLIILSELINTAIETIIDRISPQYHELSKKAKDTGSLLVLLAFINALILWIGFLYEL